MDEGRTRIRQGDCLVEMAKLADRSVDHVITDPPYSRHVHAKSRRGMAQNYVEPSRPNSRRAQISRNRDLGFDCITQDLREAVAAQFARLARRWVLVFTDGESNHLWRQALTTAGLEYVRTCYWEKLRATPQLTGDRPADHVEHIVAARQPEPNDVMEHIVVAHRTHDSGKPRRKAWNGGGKGNIYRLPIVLSGAGESRVHTTQKPLALMEALVRDFTVRAELILDPFAGSGTTLVAAQRLGRVGLGFESQTQYVDVAKRRLAVTCEQTDLFEQCGVGQ